METVRNYTYSSRRKYSAGMLECYLNVSEGIIQRAAIQGDFFGEKPVEHLAEKLIGLRHDLDELLPVLQGLSVTAYIRGLSAEELAESLLSTKADIMPSSNG